VGLKDAHRLAGLHQQGLVVAEPPQLALDRVVGGPVAGRLADPAVDHQLGRVLSDVGMQVVAQHP